MSRAFLSLVVAGLLASAAGAQDTFVEIRFHRVHLRNGNFIDGTLLRQNDREVTLKIKYGDISIRNDLIARTDSGTLRIEFMKIRDVLEKPPVMPAPAEKIPEGRRDPFEKTLRPRTPAPPKAPVEPVLPPAEGNEAVDRILRRIKNSEPERRSEIIEQLYPLGEPAALYLAGSLERFDEETRGYASTALVRMGHKKVLAIIKKLLASKDSSVRNHAVNILGSLGSSSDAADLYALLRDPDAATRGAAVMTLKNLGGVDAFPPVVAVCIDPDARVRSQAIDASFELAKKHGIEENLNSALESLVDRARGEPKADVLTAIGRTGRKEFSTLLERNLGDEEAVVRAQAVMSLIILEAKESVEAIAARFDTERDELPRQQLAFAAGKFRIRKAIPYLISWLEGEDTASKEAAHRTLKQLTNQNIPVDHEQWFKWWEQMKGQEPTMEKPPE